MNIKIPFVDFKLQSKPIENQIQSAIQDVLEKGDFVLGQALRDFEIAFAAACGTTYGVGVASGTDAIVLGLQACNIQPGDEVILPANTFVASVIGVLRAGAKPILVDCDPQTALIDLEAAAQSVTPKTKAIIPVHLYGQMVSPKKLLEFANTHKVLIFEDAAQAHLAQRDGYRAGSVGTAAAFSFYPSKNLGAYGDGGMVVTRDPDIAEKLRSLRNYGAPQKYFHVELGTNSRLDTLQAAILLCKLPYLTSWNRERLNIARQYDTELTSLASNGIIPIQNHSNDGHVYHLYVIKVEESCAIKRQSLQKLLADVGIQTGIHYPLPCHLQPAFANLGYQTGDFPHAEKLAEEILSLPMYPGLTNSQVKEVVAAISFHLSVQQNKLLYI